ncbi:hypothetical protein PanWU01x14_221300, partial [Parasponia andersonii]
LTLLAWVVTSLSTSPNVPLATPNNNALAISTTSSIPSIRRIPTISRIPTVGLLSLQSFVNSVTSEATLLANAVLSRRSSLLHLLLIMPC